MTRTLAAILALTATPAFAAGQVTGPATQEPDAHIAATAADAAALDAMRRPPIIEPWSPAIEVPRIEVVPVAPVVGPIEVAAGGVPDWVYGLPLLALVPLAFDGDGFSRSREELPSRPEGVPPIVVQPPSAVPEPATWAMLIAGFAAVGAVVRRRKAVLV